MAAGARLAAPVRGLVVGGVAAALALVALMLLTSPQPRVRPTAMLSFPEFRNMCLHACHIDKARDVKGRLAVMSKCEAGALSSRFLSYQQGCVSNPANCDVPVMGCGGEFRPEMLQR